MYTSASRSCESQTQRTNSMQVKAAEYFEEKLSGFPEMPKYNHCLAAIKSANGDANAAGEYYRTAMSSDPNNVMTRNDYALHLARQGDTQASADELRRALLINKDQPTLHKNISAVYARTGRFREAVEHAKRATQLNSNDPMSHRNLARIYDSIGDSRSALTHNLKSIGLESSAYSPRAHKVNTSAFRSAAVQMIAQGGRRDEAIELTSLARNYDNIQYISPHAERTNEILHTIALRTGNEFEEMEKEERRRKEIIQIKERLLKGEMPSYQSYQPALVNTIK